MDVSFVCFYFFCLPFYVHAFNLSFLSGLVIIFALLWMRDILAFFFLLGFLVVFFLDFGIWIWSWVKNGLGTDWESVRDLTWEWRMDWLGYGIDRTGK